MKKQKLSLDQLKVKSFVTTDQKLINGGGEVPEETLPIQWKCDHGPGPETFTGDLIGNWAC